MGTSDAGHPRRRRALVAVMGRRAKRRDFIKSYLNSSRRTKSWAGKQAAHLHHPQVAPHHRLQMRVTAMSAVCRVRAVRNLLKSLKSELTIEMQRNPQNLQGKITDKKTEIEIKGDQGVAIMTGKAVGGRIPGSAE